MKRGQMDLLVNVFRVLLISLLVYLLALQLGFFTKAEVPTEETQAALIFRRLLTGLAPDGEPVGVVDLARFSSREVTDAYFEGYGDGNLWGGKLTLYLTPEALEKGEAFRTASLDEEGAAVDLLPLAKAGARGRGGGSYYARLTPVIITHDGNEELAWLRMELVRRQ